MKNKDIAYLGLAMLIQTTPTMNGAQPVVWLCWENHFYIPLEQIWYSHVPRPSACFTRWWVWLHQTN